MPWNNIQYQISNIQYSISNIQYLNSFKISFRTENFLKMMSWENSEEVLYLLSGRLLPFILVFTSEFSCFFFSWYFYIDSGSSDSPWWEGSSVEFIRGRLRKLVKSLHPSQPIGGNHRTGIASKTGKYLIKILKYSIISYDNLFISYYIL